EARDYLRARAGGGDAHERASQQFPHVAAAERLAEDAAACGQLKVLVLGDCPRAEIAGRLRLTPEVVGAWEDLFFDARAARASAGWLRSWVIAPEERAGHSRLAAQLKFACAGPHAARAALDAGSRVPLSQGGRLFDNKVLLALKLDEAAQAPLATARD